MSKYVTVRVTQEDIDAGKVFSSTSCPIARAVRRVGYPRAIVMASRWFSDYEIGGHGELPRSAIRFIADFDSHRLVQPATFRLPLP